VLGDGSGSLDGSSDLKVPLLPTVVPRLEQILAEVVANASSKSGNRSKGQDTERAAAAGYVVRRGTQFFKDGKPFYFVGGNVSVFLRQPHHLERSPTQGPCSSGWGTPGRVSYQLRQLSRAITAALCQHYLMEF